ncbi:MAG: DNA polymerase III subunit gamma/tau [Burkholderiales bacterium]|nr:DNA polymerase III subunit gamma/tau [Burkholderiales bacterium]
MSYQALARKWRPKNFSELAGQEHVVQALTNALTQNRLHHAYLLTGTRGVGKTTIARILAKSLNCERGVTAAPCGICAACVAIDEGRFVDLIELDAASNTGIDNMREILDTARYAPTVGRYKVYLIDEVHMLSRSAFNSMLKTLEEPPEHVKFVLATTDPQKIPITVLSRCLQFNLKQLPPPIVARQLEHVLTQEGIGFEPGAIRVLARAAQGSMRDGLSLLDQAIAYGTGGVEEAVVRQMLGAVETDYVLRLLEALAARDGERLFGEAQAMAERNLAFDAALQDLAVCLHDIALLQTVPGAIPDDQPGRDRLVELARRLDPETVQLDYQIAVQGRNDLSIAPDEFAGFSMTLLRMLAFAPGGRPAIAAGTNGTKGTKGMMGTTGMTGTPVAAVTVAAAVAVAVAPAVAADAGAAPMPAASANAAPLPPTAATGEWPGLIGQCRLSGLAQQLAYNAELKSRRQTPTGIEMELALPESNRHLAERAYQDKLREALGAALGAPVRLRIEIGGEGACSMAAQDRRARQLLQENAAASFNADPFVRDAVRLFDARVRPQSIQPVAMPQGNEP